MTMALDDEDQTQDQDQDESLDDAEGDQGSLSTDSKSTPDFLKNIVGKNSLPIDMEIPALPANPYTLNGNQMDYKSSLDIQGIKQPSSFYDTAKAEAYDWNSTAQGIHAEYDKFDDVNPSSDPHPPGWTPKTDKEKFVNIKPEYLPYLFGATGPKEQDFRLQRIYSEQAHDETLENGSFTAKLVGGILGAVTDPISYIPIVGVAKYAKFAPSILKSAQRALPGVAAYSVLSSAAKQTDRINGNLSDFAKDAFINTVFGTALFGVGGALGLSADKLQLWNLRKMASGGIDGIDYKLAADADGKVTGFKAVDTTGGLSAQKVSYYQDLADSSFSKSGFFKIPYLGAGISHILDMKVPGTNFYFGSQLRSLLSSSSNVVRGYIDRIADHSIITKGVEEGQAAPKKFASLMQQSMANVRALDVQLTAMHLERNGFNIKNRIASGVVDTALNLKDKGLKLLGKDLDKDAYVSKDDFHSEIEDVLLNGNSSEHAPVNDAAAMLRKHMDETYTNYRDAYGLPKDWMPPKTADGYLMRVYNTPLMNTHENEWISNVSGWLKQADETIKNRMQPIEDMDHRLKRSIEHKKSLNQMVNVSDQIHKEASDEIVAMKARKKALVENLQNELRNNPDLALHVEDWNALSADEAKQVLALTKKQRIALKEVNERKAIVQKIKDEASKREAASVKAKTASTAKSNVRKSAIGEQVAEQEQVKLDQVQREYEDETQKLQEKMHNGEIDQRLFTKKKDSFQYEMKDPKNRLKFRDTYGSKGNPISPESHAKAYYDTIMNQTPEQTIAQVMGKLSGNETENSLKQRTLLIPDNVLYGREGENGVNFMSKDLMSKVANYTSFLSRRTHLKTVFNDVTVDGGIEPLIKNLQEEFQQNKSVLNEAKAKAKDPKQIAKIEKEMASLSTEFDRNKDNMNHLYSKMMGTKNYSKGVEKARSVIMSLTAIANLPFVPFTQITDLSAVALKHGVWPFIRDGLVPTIQNLATLNKSKEGEAFRKTAPSIHLALQDVLNGYADRNWTTYTQPYLNLGKWVDNLQHVAHLSSNFTGTNYIDNFLQRFTASVTQSELMRILNAFKAGTMSKKDGIYIRQYGIDPAKWADRMVAAFDKDGGGKTKLGGYQSLFHQWSDMEAANEFGQGVFRGVKDTQIQQGIADSPFWTDNPMGTIIKGFSGWMYASVNRYLIPSMQQPDAQRLIGVMVALGAGALVDPMRRMARGEDAYPENQTDTQKLYAAFNNANIFSFFGTVLSNANLLSGDRLLGNLKSDKYKDRTRAGLLGPSMGTFDRTWDIIGAASTGEWNKADMTKAARMLPFVNASWTYWMSKNFIDGMNIPQTRAQAHAINNANE